MCCGKKRAALAAQQRGLAPAGQADAEAFIAYRYTGHSALVTTGTVTGQIYRFVSKGAVQLVHPRDAGSLEEVPGLERI
ncbi:hypothetical protein [Chitinophaga japonensis]|uniref:Uncharacterized protein n=1 Tax=Chitinophaga japonensis TaxID=104662 RepID=A0A562SME7_CHIJA|nr:hypothetical protein [Chitinophaga japonensis]TWI82408.1 hypothetical protein LX66_4980 [Chitinophaga japonensis]